jgi:hypothetical protein
VERRRRRRERLQAAAVPSQIAVCVITRKKSGNIGVTSVEAFIQLIYFKIIIGGFPAYTYTMNFL